MTIGEQIDLELRKPHGAELYSCPVEQDDYRASVAVREIDSHTGLIYGAVEFGDFLVTNETALTLIRMLERLSAGERNVWASNLVQGLTPSNRAIVAAVIMELGLLHLLFQLQSVNQHVGIAAGLDAALKFRPRTGSDEDVARVKAWATERRMIAQAHADLKKLDGPPMLYDIGGSAPTLNLLIEAAEDVQRFRLRNHYLRGEDPSIQRDRRELVDRLATLQVDNTIRALLDAADKDANGGDVKGAMDKVRTFLERTIEACCLRYAAPAGKNPLPVQNSGGSIGPWVQWAEHAGLVKKNEHALIQSLYNFLSLEGSHAPSSEPRQYAIGRSMVIESCLLVADRVG